MADVTIMGAGIFGLSIAWECLRRGAHVQVIDPNGACSGSSGGVVGALSPHTPENWNVKKQVQFDSLLAAETFWVEVDGVSGLSSGYGRVGRLQPVADARALELARDRAVQAFSLWQGKAQWVVLPAREAGRWAPISPTGWLIHDTLSARVHPQHAGQSLVRALQERGVSILQAGASTGRVIWATGYQGLLDLSRDLGKPVGNGVKGQAAVLGFDAGDAPQLFADGIHIIPHMDGTVAVGSTSEREFDDPTSTDGTLEEVIAAARVACPALADAPVLARWAGVRPRAKSRAPMLGAWPGRPEHFIANGGFKIGFGMAPAVAQMMVDLVLDEVYTIPDAFKVVANL